MASIITQLIDGRGEGYEDGLTCWRKYWCNGEPTAFQLPVHGQPYTLQSGWPAGYKVTTYRLDALVDPVGFELTVNGATVIKGGTTQTGADGTLKRNLVTRTPGQQSLTITADMVGARKATKEDSGDAVPDGDASSPTQGTATNKRDGADASKWRVPICLDPEIFAEEGQWIYQTGRRRYTYLAGKVHDRTLASVGGPNHLVAPFWIDAESGTYTRLERTFRSNGTVSGTTQQLYSIKTSPLHLEFIGAQLSMMKHTVSYHVKTNADYTKNIPHPYTFAGWVSDWGPKNGRIYGPLLEAVPDTRGMWRCHEQQVSQDTDNDGQLLIKIERSFLCVPRLPTAGRMFWNYIKYGKWTPDWPS